jgi:hypothetical protein
MINGYLKRIKKSREMEIKIPFTPWSEERILKGLKKSTSRYDKYAKVGDIFSIDGKKFYVNLVVKLPLWFIRNELYKTEGCETEKEFEDIWIDIHPKRGFIMEDNVWYHHFTVYI